MQKSKDVKKHGIVLAIIIAVQILMLIYTGTQKKEYHIDEIYSYVLSNSYDTDRISNAEQIWNNWINGELFREFVTVQKGERFSYPTVYRNNSTDCHPPLFYWILHTVCSFFPDTFSKWTGLFINILLFSITEIFIWLISDKLTEKTFWKFIPVIMWGFSLPAVDVCTFIRMYMLLTMLTVCFAYFNLKMFKFGTTLKRMTIVWITIYLGAMTHYYSLVVCFWGVLFFSLYLIRKKEIKTMLTYGIGACVSVGLMILSYPYVIEQATGSPTNNVGNQVMKNLFNFSLWTEQTKKLAESLIKSISYNAELSKLIGSLFIEFILVMLLLRIKDKSISAVLMNLKETFWLIGVFVFSFLSISFIGGEYVDIRYIYHIIPFFYTASSVVLVKVSSKGGSGSSLLTNTVLVTAIAFAFLNAAYGTLQNRSSYLFSDAAAQKEILQTYDDKRLYVIVENYSAAVPTGNMTRFELFDKIYMAEKNDITENHMISDTVLEEGACVAYIVTDTYWLNGFYTDEVLKEELRDCNGKYEKISEGSLGEFYYIYI